MMYSKALVLVLAFSLTIHNCSPSDNNPPEGITVEQTATDLYFPPIGSNIWEMVSASSLGWNTNQENELYGFLENSGTKAFIILKSGRIVNEWYMNGFSTNDFWYWASAGKTLTAFTLGIAQEEGFLDINNASSEYLGSGWSNLTAEQESAITVFNHVTMTTGLDYATNHGTFCTDPSCLHYLNGPGEFWYYHNAPYTLIDGIITGAVGEDFEDYFKTKIADKIGMNGLWQQNGYNNIYRSNARSMARFGLLCLNNGKWNNDTIMADENYFNDMINTSQNLNKAYGFLWWLNGKSSYKLPSSIETFDGKLIPNAPDDLIAGLGANDQKLYIVPSKDLVIIRMGNNGGQGQLGPSSYDNSLWEKISEYIN